MGQSKDGSGYAAKIMKVSCENKLGLEIVRTQPLDGKGDFSIGAYDLSPQQTKM